MTTTLAPETVDGWLIATAHNCSGFRTTTELRSRIAFELADGPVGRDGLLLAALYTVALRDIDALSGALWDVHAADTDLHNPDCQPAHEDVGRCLSDCQTCTDIKANALADALGQLRWLLGDTVIGDLTRALVA